MERWISIEAVLDCKTIPIVVAFQIQKDLESNTIQMTERVCLDGPQ